MNFKSVTVLALGLVIGYTYSEYNVADKQSQVYGSRDIESDLKKEVERVNSILETTEKKNIKKENVPKPLNLEAKVFLRSWSKKNLASAKRGLTTRSLPSTTLNGSAGLMLETIKNLLVSLSLASSNGKYF